MANKKELDLVALRQTLKPAGQNKTQSTTSGNKTQSTGTSSTRSSSSVASVPKATIEGTIRDYNLTDAQADLLRKYVSYMRGRGSGENQTNSRRAAGLTSSQASKLEDYIYNAPGYANYSNYQTNKAAQQAAAPQTISEGIMLRCGVCTTAAALASAFC